MYFKLIMYITDKNIQFYIKATVRVSCQLTTWQCWGNLQVWFNGRDCSSFREKDETRSFICLRGQDVANLMIKTPASWKLPPWKMITIPASVLQPTTTNKNKGNKWGNPPQPEAFKASTSNFLFPTCLRPLVLLNGWIHIWDN